MFGKMGELKKMYDKYKSLQKVLQKIVVRAKEGSYKDANGDMVDGAVVVDINGEMKLKDFKVNDESLLNPSRRADLEKIVITCFQKAQTKAQEVVAEKTKETLGFDPSNLGSMMGGAGMPGLS